MRLCLRDCYWAKSNGKNNHAKNRRVSILFCGKSNRVHERTANNRALVFSYFVGIKTRILLANDCNLKASYDKTNCSRDANARALTNPNQMDKCFGWSAI